MKTGYLFRAGKYRIERFPCPHPDEDVNLAAPAAGVMHTTEGGWAGSLAVFKQHYAPHFMVGRDSMRNVRILQLVPLRKMSAALEHPDGYPETNRVCRAQIEVVGYSKTTPYSFDPQVSDALAALLAQLKVDAQIPLSRPFPDTMPPLPWSVRSFARRHSGKWGHVPGWYGHVEVPGNSHWDPGALEWADLLVAANGKLPNPPRPTLPGPSPKPDWFWWWSDWHRAGRVDLRPVEAPRLIPPWAWLALRKFNRLYPPS